MTTTSFMPELISLTTPALLFPAISLLLLAYTNRFFALAALIRNLSSHEPRVAIEQINNLKKRIAIIRRMQETGVISFALCVVCMLFIYLGFNKIGSSIFGLSLGLLLYSLLLSVREIHISMDAINLHLQEIEQKNKSQC